MITNYLHYIHRQVTDEVCERACVDGRGVRREGMCDVCEHPQNSFIYLETLKIRQAGWAEATQQ
jgi:hypothetical protein